MRPAVKKITDIQRHWLAFRHFFDEVEDQVAHPLRFLVPEKPQGQESLRIDWLLWEIKEKANSMTSC
jgi:hypothetical protein